VKARWLLSLLEPALGTRPVNEITPVELLAALKKVESKGRLETARRVRAVKALVSDWLVETDVNGDDTADLLVLVSVSDADRLMVEDFVL
jgi:hypothetical protein